jgi:hypothetical protein
MLYLTSFIFGTCALHATAFGEYMLGGLFMIQHGLSTIHHSHYTLADTYWMGQWVACLDRLVARVLWLSILCKNYTLPYSLAKQIVYLCIAYVPYVYFRWCTKYSYYKPFERSYRTYTHGSIHLMSGLGSHLYLLLAYPPKAFKCLQI